MRIAIIFLLSLYLCSTGIVKAQISYKNNVFIENGGLGYFISLNYERILLNNENYLIGLRFGEGPERVYYKWKWFPIYHSQLSFCYGGNNRYFDAGIGSSIQKYIFLHDYPDQNGYEIWSFVFKYTAQTHISYRLYSSNNRFFYRFLFMVKFTEFENSKAFAFYEHFNNKKWKFMIQPWAGFSVGYCF